MTGVLYESTPKKVLAVVGYKHSLETLRVLGKKLPTLSGCGLGHPFDFDPTEGLSKEIVRRGRWALRPTE